MTLYTSAISKEHKTMAKTGFVYLFISLFCALFGAVYEVFSHEVYSYYMIYAFGFPLAGGALPFFTLAFASRSLPSKVSLNLYHCAIATLTIGSILQGVLEIYGTTNRLIYAYWIVGLALFSTSIILYIVRLTKKP